MSCGCLKTDLMNGNGRVTVLNEFLDGGILVGKVKETVGGIIDPCTQVARLDPGRPSSVKTHKVEEGGGGYQPQSTRTHQQLLRGMAKGCTLHPGVIRPPDRLPP